MPSVLLVVSQTLSCHCAADIRNHSETECFFPSWPFPKQRAKLSPTGTQSRDAQTAARRPTASRGQREATRPCPWGGHPPGTPHPHSSSGVPAPLAPSPGLPEASTQQPVAAGELGVSTFVAAGCLGTRGAFAMGPQGWHGCDPMSLHSPDAGAIRGWALGMSGSVPALPDPSQPRQPSPKHWDPLGPGEPRVPAPQLRSCPAPGARCARRSCSAAGNSTNLVTHWLSLPGHVFYKSPGIYYMITSLEKPN